MQEANNKKVSRNTGEMKNVSRENQSEEEEEQETEDQGEV